VGVGFARKKGPEKIRERFSERKNHNTLFLKEEAKASSKRNKLSKGEVRATRSSAQTRKKRGGEKPRG